MVLTSELDMFPEQFSPENIDLAELNVVPAYGINAANAYRFRVEPGAAQMGQFRRDAAVAGAALAFPQGLALAAPAPAAAAVAAPAGSCNRSAFQRRHWRCVRNAGESSVTVYKG